MSAYTKGPWQVHSEHNPWLVVANIDGPDDERYSFDTICDCDQDSSTRLDSDETKANARLIAAAPELLEALKLCKEQWQHSAPGDCYSRGPSTGDLVQDHLVCPGCEVQRQIDAAIAKAEGR